MKTERAYFTIPRRVSFVTILPGPHHAPRPGYERPALLNRSPSLPFTLHRCQPGGSTFSNRSNHRPLLYFVPHHFFSVGLFTSPLKNPLNASGFLISSQLCRRCACSSPLRVAIRLLKIPP